MLVDWHLNAEARARLDLDPPATAPRALHRTLPGYAPTPLHVAPAAGGGELLLKDETSRLGLPAFKILGASWAVEQALARAGGGARALVTATDGNHGRAVARTARIRGLAARIFVPDDIAEARREAIAAEGAEVVDVPGGYDEAVAAAAASLGHGDVLVADTDGPAQPASARDVIDGYGTLLAEVDDQLDEAPGPDLAVVPVGVGVLAAAVVRHLRHRDRRHPARIVSVEPEHAACALAAVRAGHPVDVPGPHDSVMAGLNCGRVSSAAWPALRAGVDAFAAIDDDMAREGVRALADLGIAAGECAGGTFGTALELLADPARRAALGLDAAPRVLVLLTEGPTDPSTWAEITSGPLPPAR